MTNPLTSLIQQLMNSQFIRYGMVGAAGFLVDWALLTIALNHLGLNFYTGRLFSFLGAATFTWAVNRSFTFPHSKKRTAGEQWRRFVTVMTVGWAVNYGTYAALIYFFDIVKAWPVIGIAAGSICGLAFNYNGARHLVFDGAAEPEETS